LSQASSVGVIAAASVYLLKFAIVGDKDAWWRLIAILAAGTMLWLLLRGDLAHLLQHLQPVTSVPTNRDVTATGRPG
jgi:hypothetical protein